MNLEYCGKSLIPLEFIPNQDNHGTYPKKIIRGPHLYFSIRAPSSGRLAYSAAGNYDGSLLMYSLLSGLMVWSRQIADLAYALLNIGRVLRNYRIHHLCQAIF